VIRSAEIVSASVSECQLVRASPDKFQRILSLAAQRAAQRNEDENDALRCQHLIWYGQFKTFSPQHTTRLETARLVGSCRANRLEGDNTVYLLVSWSSSFHYARLNRFYFVKSVSNPFNVRYYYYSINQSINLSIFISGTEPIEQ